MNQRGGFILVTTLFMISVLSLLILSLLQLVFINFKLSNQWIADYQTLYALESLADQIQHQIPNISGKCLSHQHHFNAELVNKHGCVLETEKERYYYLVSDLGQFACLEMMFNETKFTSHHWLIGIMKENLLPVLQIRIATADVYIPCELDQPTRIDAGVMSWHYPKFSS